MIGCCLNPEMGGLGLYKYISRVSTQETAETVEQSRKCLLIVTQWLVIAYILKWGARPRTIGRRHTVAFM